MYFLLAKLYMYAIYCLLDVYHRQFDILEQLEAVVFYDHIDSSENLYF
jgi:hypothetical protein